MNHTLTNRVPARSVRDRGRDIAAQIADLERTNMAALEAEAIARRIRDARKEAGLSQPDMAETLGVVPRTYQNYEAHEDPRTPWGLLDKIAMVTGKTTQWLIHGEFADTSTADQVEQIREEFHVRVDRLEVMIATNHELLTTLLVALAPEAAEAASLRAVRRTAAHVRETAGRKGSADGAPPAVPERPVRRQSSGPAPAADAR